MWLELSVEVPRPPDAGIDDLVESDEEALGDLVLDDLDALRIALVEEKRDGLADEAHGGFEVAPEEGDGAVLGDLPADGDAEVVAQVLGRGPEQGDLGEEAGHRRLARRAVDALVVLPVDPFREELVEPLEREPVGKGRQELLPDGEEEALDLAAPFRDVGPRMEEGDAEPAAGVGERVGPEGRAVVDIEPAGETALLEGRDEAVAEAVEALGEIELGVGDEPGVVVEDGEEIGLPELAFVDDLGTVHAVRLPQVVGQLGLETAAVFRKPRVLLEAVPLEEPVEAVLRGSLSRSVEDLPAPRQLHEDRQADRRMLLPEGDQGGFELGAEGPARAAVLPGLRLEGLDPQPRLLVERHPAQHRRPRDRGAGRAGDLPALRHDVAERGFLLAAAHAPPVHQGADDREAEKRDVLRSSWSIPVPPPDSIGRYGGAVAASLRWGGSGTGKVVRSTVEWVAATTNSASRACKAAGGRPSKRLWMR